MSHLKDEQDINVFVNSILDSPRTGSPLERVDFCGEVLIGHRKWSQNIHKNMRLTSTTLMIRGQPYKESASVPRSKSHESQLNLNPHHLMTIHG